MHHNSPIYVHFNCSSFGTSINNNVLDIYFKNQSTPKGLRLGLLPPQSRNRHSVVHILSGTGVWLSCSLYTCPLMMSHRESDEGTWARGRVAVVGYPVMPSPVRPGKSHRSASDSTTRPRSRLSYLHQDSCRVFIYFPVCLKTL